MATEETTGTRDSTARQLPKPVIERTPSRLRIVLTAVAGLSLFVASNTGLLGVAWFTGTMSDCSR